MNIKDMLYDEDKNKKTVRFIKYFDQNLWYKTVDGFEFPVPISDIGNATFVDVDFAPLFMRWIRKQMSVVEESRRQ